MTAPRWEHFAHGADIGVRGFGATKEEAFAGAALAMTAVVADPASVRPEETVSVRCTAPDDEILLVDWLNALVFEMATRGMLFCEFQVRIGDRTLAGEAVGEAVNPKRHMPAVEVKGATFTELRVARDPSGTWVAQCVVDV